MSAAPKPVSMPDAAPRQSAGRDLASLHQALDQFVREEQRPETATPRVAVLIPCFNEQAAVEQVVADFRASLPNAAVFVYDNNSTDRTVAVAEEAGAQVRHVRRQGKGHVVRRMFADIDADIYVLVDGDATYDAPSAPRMIARLADEHLDMVVGLRTDRDVSAYRRGHRFGNAMMTGCLAAVFGQAFKDVLSGYRVF